MRKLLLLLFMMSSTILNAQNAFYIKPAIGIGVGNMTNHDYKTKSTPAYRGEIALGWQLKNIQLETGVSYLHTGFIIKNYSMLDLYNHSHSGDTIHFSSKNLILPIRVGITLPASNRVKFFPSVGICVSALLNTSTKYVSNINDKQVVSSANSSVNKTALWTTASFQTEIKLSEKKTLTAGPTLMYDLTTFISNSPIRLYNIQFNLGIAHTF